MTPRARLEQEKLISNTTDPEALRAIARNYLQHIIEVETRAETLISSVRIAEDKASHLASSRWNG